MEFEGRGLPLFWQSGQIRQAQIGEEQHGQWIERCGFLQGAGHQRGFCQSMGELHERADPRRTQAPVARRQGPLCVHVQHFRLRLQMSLQRA